jgi:predicted cobalt transporter CbtA
VSPYQYFAHTPTTTLPPTTQAPHSPQIMSSKSSIDAVESEGLLGVSAMRLKNRDYRLWAWLKFSLIVSSVLLNVLTAIGLAYVLATGVQTCTRPNSSYEHGFTTDLGKQACFFIQVCCPLANLRL